MNWKLIKTRTLQWLCVCVCSPDVYPFGPLTAWTERLLFELRIINRSMCRRSRRRQLLRLLTCTRERERERKNVRRQTRKHTWPFVSDTGALSASGVCVLLRSSLWTLPQFQMGLSFPLTPCFFVPEILFSSSISSMACKVHGVCPCVTVRKYKSSARSTVKGCFQVLARCYLKGLHWTFNLCSSNFTNTKHWIFLSNLVKKVSSVPSNWRKRGLWNAVRSWLILTRA